MSTALSTRTSTSIPLRLAAQVLQGLRKSPVEGFVVLRRVADGWPLALVDLSARRVRSSRTLVHLVDAITQTNTRLEAVAANDERLLARSLPDEPFEHLCRQLEQRLAIHKQADPVRFATR